MLNEEFDKLIAETSLKNVPKDDLRAAKMVFMCAAARTIRLILLALKNGLGDVFLTVLEMEAELSAFRNELYARRNPQETSEGCSPCPDNHCDSGREVASGDQG